MSAPTCKGMTLKGLQCAATALEEDGFCANHSVLALTLREIKAEKQNLATVRHAIAAAQRQVVEAKEVAADAIGSRLRMLALGVEFASKGLAAEAAVFVDIARELRLGQDDPYKRTLEIAR